MTRRVKELEQKVGVVVKFYGADRAMLVRLVDWLRVGNRIRVRKPKKNEKGRSIQNPQELRIKFEMTAEEIHLDGKSVGRALPGQVVRVLEVPRVRKANEPKEGDWVFRVWQEELPCPNGPIPTPEPPPDPEPPNPGLPPIEPPPPKRRPESGNDDDEEPDLPDPDDIDEDGKRGKGRGVGG